MSGRISLAATVLVIGVAVAFAVNRQDSADPKRRRGERGAVDSLAAGMSSLREAANASPSNNARSAPFRLGVRRWISIASVVTVRFKVGRVLYCGGEHIATPCAP